MRNNTLSFCLGFIVCFFLLSTCDHFVSEGTETTKTVYVPVKEQGSFKRTEDSIVYVQVPGGDSVLIQKQIIRETDTLWVFEKVWQPIDTAAILHDYFAKRYYGDTIDVQYGKLYLWDTLSKNRITGTGWRLEQSIPQITITKTQPKKIKGYLTGSIQGTLADPLQGFAPGVMIQFKNDDAVEFQKWFYKSPFPEPTYQLSYKFKLSFKN